MNWNHLLDKLVNPVCQCCFEPLISLRQIVENPFEDQNWDIIRKYFEPNKSSYQIVFCQKCLVFIHKSCKLDEGNLKSNQVQIHYENQTKAIELETFKCESCKYLKRKQKEPRCFECYNQGGYIVGLNNDTTQDRMVHPICALMNRRFTIPSPSQLGFSLSNKYSRQIVEDQKCFKCLKRIVYECKCVGSQCLVFAHYFCLNQERSSFQIAVEDKKHKELWNFHYSFQMENFDLQKLPIFQASFGEYFTSQEIHQQEDSECPYQISDPLKEFIAKHEKTLNIIFRCNNH